MLGIRKVCKGFASSQIGRAASLPSVGHCHLINSSGVVCFEISAETQAAQQCIILLKALVSLHVWLEMPAAASRRAATCRCQERLLAWQCMHHLFTRRLLAAL